MTTPTLTKDFRFDYKKYTVPGLKVEQLDDMMKPLLTAEISTISMIFLGIRVAMIFFYLRIRHSLIESQQLVEKQNYELGTTNANKDEISGDSLDGK